jgi:hypothetical protein
MDCPSSATSFAISVPEASSCEIANVGSSCPLFNPVVPVGLLLLQPTISASEAKVRTAVKVERFISNSFKMVINETKFNFF